MLPDLVLSFTVGWQLQFSYGSRRQGWMQQSVIDESIDQWRKRI